MGTIEREWTDEQRTAVSHGISGKSALVSAAAGSGKTAVLVERILRLICDNSVQADKIALVTFTKKAAGEMKERLAKSLNERLENASFSESALLRKQLIKLEQAQISTINAFCLNLLRENSGFVNLAPGFKVADETDLELLSKQAMQLALEKFYDGQADEIKSVCAFFGGNGDSNLQKAVRDLYKFTRNIPDSEEWLDKQLDLFGNPDKFFNETVPGYWQSVKKDIQKAIEITEKSLDCAEFDKTNKFLNADLDFFKGYYNDYNYNGIFPRMDIDRNEDDSVKEVIRENRKKTGKIKDECVTAGVLIGDFKNAATRLCPIVRALVALEREYASEFMNIKLENKVIDFADTEHLCLKLLRAGSGIRERIGNNYELVIVDEFQDSNYLQYEIFRLLDSGRGRLFFVGDVKQSIYGFRGADCEVFESVHKNKDYTHMYLSKNFRSSKQVTDSVNEIFGFKNSAGETVIPDYDENARLKQGLNIDREEYTTELVLTESDGEAEYTARAIKKMVRCGEFDWGDFAVLTSAGEKNFKVYERVFREHGIPCASAGGGGYLKRDEVALALDFLAVINNPYNDLSLFNVMLSPLFGFNAEDLAVIRVNGALEFKSARSKSGKNNKKSPLYSSILATERVKTGIPQALKIKIANFLKTVSYYRRMADVCSASELISAVNANGDFSPLISDLNRQANIRLLSYYAQKFSENNGDSGLAAFLSYVKNINEVGAVLKMANTNAIHNADDKSSGCVKLMTIHGAKGLEFPVCFVGRVHTAFNFRGSQEVGVVRFNKTAGITADYFEPSQLCRYKTLLSDYERRLSREFTTAEEARKLYVAATRAQKKLIFTGEKSKSGKIRENCYLEWISQSQFKSHIKTISDEIEDVGIVGETQEAKMQEAQENQKNTAFLKEYKRAILSTVPRKMTATQIGVVKSRGVASNSFENDEPAIFPRNPSFYSVKGEKRLTGKKRGDAFHKAMELLDFAKGDYLAQLEHIESRFTPIEYKALDFSAIARFFDCELGKRAVKSPKVVKEYKLYTQIELSQVIDLSQTSEAVDLSEFNDKPFVQGIADMFFCEDGEIVLTDYKTNRNTTAEKLIHDYKGQLSVYKRAIEEMTGLKVKECWIYSFEKGAVLIHGI